MALDADFETVFRAQFPRLVALGLAMTGNRDLATNLAQETMARAHARWDEVCQMGSPEGWMREVMTNLLIDNHRRGKVEQRALERLAARPRSRESTIAAGGDVDLGDLLAMLPPRQRAVVALYYLEDLPVVAIAEALGVANGRSRHCCGRRGLHSPTDSNWSADVDEFDRTLRVAARVTHERAAESLDIDAEMASTLPSSALSRARGGRMPPLRRSSRCGSCVSRADLH